MRERQGKVAPNYLGEIRDISARKQWAKCIKIQLSQLFVLVQNFEALSSDKFSEKQLIPFTLNVLTFCQSFWYLIILMKIRSPRTFREKRYLDFQGSRYLICTITCTVVLNRKPPNPIWWKHRFTIIFVCAVFSAHYFRSLFNPLYYQYLLIDPCLQGDLYTFPVFYVYWRNVV